MADIAKAVQSGQGHCPLCHGSLVGWDCMLDENKIKGAMWPHLLLYALSPVAIITSEMCNLTHWHWLFDLGLRTYPSTKGEHGKGHLGWRHHWTRHCSQGPLLCISTHDSILMWWHKSSSRAPFSRLGCHGDCADGACGGMPMPISFGHQWCNFRFWCRRPSSPPWLWADSKTWMVLGRITIKHVLTPLGPG